MTIQRCGWCSEDPFILPTMIWNGQPVYAEAHLFENALSRGATSRLVVDYCS